MLKITLELCTGSLYPECAGRELWAKTTSLLCSICMMFSYKEVLLLKSNLLFFSFQSQELIDRLSLHWKERKDFKSNEVTLTCEPFRLCLLQDFLANSEMINNIVDDMNTLDWSRKKMDLYEFHQTADLASLTWQRSIRGIYELLKTEVMSWVSPGYTNTSTGYEL